MVGNSRLGTLLASALIIAALAGCSAKEKEPEPVVSVQVANAETASIDRVVDTEAILFPRQQAAITPKITAPVVKFYVNRGSRVKRGQLLAVLENRDLDAARLDTQGAYDQAQAVYATATASSLPEEWQKAEFDVKSAKEAFEVQQKVYDNRKQLYEQGALPRRELDDAGVALIQARSQYELSQKHLAALQTGGKEQALKGAKGQLVSAEGKYRGAAAQLAYSEIHSPIDGVVTDRPLYAGETPAAGTPLLTVMDTATVIARAHIPQDEAVLLKPGDAASVTGPGDVAASGKVMLVSPALDPNSTTVEVWIEIPNSDGRLRPGSTVRVNVVAETARNALVIPAPALLKTPEGKISVVVVDRASMAHLTPVEVGIRNGECVQITKGLTAGDTVIVSGGYGLPDRTKVNPSPAPGAEVASPAGGNEP